MELILRKAMQLIRAASPVGVVVSPNAAANYDFTEDFILDNKNKYNGESVFRFAYNPKTRELVFGPRNEMHSVMIHNQGKSPFDQFVRGVYDGSTVYLRWYSTDPYASEDEVKAQSFEAWMDTKEMLERNGMPPGTEVVMGVSTQDLRDEFDGYR